MGFKEALEFLGRGETPSDKAPATEPDERQIEKVEAKELAKATEGAEDDAATESTPVKGGKAAEFGLTPKNVTEEDLKSGTVESLESEPAQDSSGADQEAMGGESEVDKLKKEGLPPLRREQPAEPPNVIKVGGEHAGRVMKHDKEEVEEKKPSPSDAEESTEHPSAKAPATEPDERQIEKVEAKELAKAEAMESNTDREGDLRENVVDKAAPDSGQLLGRKAADELEPGTATLAAAFLPLSLLGNEPWVWIVVLSCIAVAVYFFLRWYFRRGESTSLPKEESKRPSGDPIRDFMENY